MSVDYGCERTSAKQSIRPFFILCMLSLPYTIYGTAKIFPQYIVLFLILDSDNV